MLFQHLCCRSLKCIKTSFYKISRIFSGKVLLLCYAFTHVEIQIKTQVQCKAENVMFRSLRPWFHVLFVEPLVSCIVLGAGAGGDVHDGLAGEAAGQ